MVDVRMCCIFSSHCFVLLCKNSAMLSAKMIVSVHIVSKLKSCNNVIAKLAGGTLWGASANSKICSNFCTGK